MKHLSYLSAMLVITFIAALIYISVQHVHRSEANDPQVQLAHDLRDRIQQGRLQEPYGLDDSIDLARSLDVFTSLYDGSGRPLASNARLGGQIPLLPAGVLHYVNDHGEDWVTWQPQKDTRLATVILRVNNPPVRYIAVGRSLSLVEDRTNHLGTMALLCWILCLVIVGINWLAYFYTARKITV